MILAEFLIFVMFAALLVVSPGPNGLLIARSVGVSGKPRAVWNIAGFISSFYLHGLISIFGLSAIIMNSAQVYFVLKLLGAAYLCFIGVKSLLGAYTASQNQVRQSDTQQPSKQHTAEFSQLTGFVEGFLTNALNPKVSLFYLAAFPQFIGQSDSIFYWGLLLVTTHAVMNAVWFYVFACIVYKTKKVLVSPRCKQYLQGFSGFVFIGFAIKLVTSKQPS